MKSPRHSLLASGLACCLATLLPAFASAQQNAEVLQSAATEAVGGASKVAEIRSLEFIGTIQMMPGQPPAPLVVRVQKPNLYWMSITLPEGETRTLFDGKQGWYRTLLKGDAGVWEKMGRRESADLANRAWESAHYAAVSPQPGRKASAENGALRLKFASGADILRKYENARLVEETTADGTSRFSDFKSFGGILFATRVSTRTPIGDVTTKFSSIKVNPSFPLGQFDAK